MEMLHVYYTLMDLDLCKGDQNEVSKSVGGFTCSL